MDDNIPDEVRARVYRELVVQMKISGPEVATVEWLWQEANRLDWQPRILNHEITQ